MSAITSQLFCNVFLIAFPMLVMEKMFKFMFTPSLKCRTVIAMLANTVIHHSRFYLWPFVLVNYSISEYVYTVYVFTRIFVLLKC